MVADFFSFFFWCVYLYFFFIRSSEVSIDRLPALRRDIGTSGVTDDKGICQGGWIYYVGTFLASSRDTYDAKCGREEATLSVPVA